MAKVGMLKEMVRQAREKRRIEEDARKVMMASLDREQKAALFEEIVLPNAIQMLGMGAERVCLDEILPEQLITREIVNAENWRDYLRDEEPRKLAMICETVGLIVTIEPRHLFLLDYDKPKLSANVLRVYLYVSLS